MKNFILLSFFLLTSNLFAGQVFYVTTSGSDSNDGKSWATAFADVQKAIDAAAEVATDDSPSEVWIAVGTYKHGSAMTMKNNVEIYGGFAGSEASKEERINGNETVFEGEESYSVIKNSSPLNSSSKLDSITITNGKNGISSIDDAVISNCTISKNKNYGVYLLYDAGAIINCLISENVIGIYCLQDVKSTISNCRIKNNLTGIHIENSSPEITNCTIKNNQEGIYTFYASPEITNCTISENEDTGIYMYYVSSPEITNCTIYKNGGDGICSGTVSDKPRY